MAKILMCSPEFFDIQYEINPWMDINKKTEKSESKRQWQNLHDKFISLGHEVSVMDGVEGLPDIVYVDCGVLYKDTFIPSNFLYPERQPESEYFSEWFKSNGFKIRNIDKIYNFEGHGDTLFAGEKLFFGYGFRSSIEAQFKINQALYELGKVKVVPVELIDSRFYHLDTCFCPLNETEAFYFPGAFSEKARSILQDEINLIPVDEDEAGLFCCNAVVLGKDILMPAGARKIKKH
ncbi:MAG: amidinotransferase [Candidatus Dojkabacteria bacterium]|nr:amidinotransferase [Candidatus Dojkabacteria bacterium]